MKTLNETIKSVNEAAVDSKFLDKLYSLMDEALEESMEFMPDGPDAVPARKAQKLFASAIDSAYDKAKRIK